MTQTIIDKLERADGPDRFLFLEAFYTVHGSELAGTRVLGYPEYAALLARGIALIDAEAWIDVAMTLVPEGWEWSLYSAQSGFRPQAQLETEVMRQREGFEPVSAFGATPALALCIAALRARSQGGE